MKFRTVEEEITPILKDHEATRCDDMLLYYCYVKNVKKANLAKAFVFKYYREVSGIAPYETVSRCRRKIQEHYPELRPTALQIERKKELEKEFRLYAKGGKYEQ
jgi:hypothetical protein